MSEITKSIGVSYKRTNPVPLDSTSVFNSLEEAQEYASTDPTAYVGQIIAVKTDGILTDLYVIPSARGALRQLDGYFTRGLSDFSTGECTTVEGTNNLITCRGRYFKGFGVDYIYLGRSSQSAPTIPQVQTQINTDDIGVTADGFNVGDQVIIDYYLGIQRATIKSISNNKLVFTEPLAFYALEGQIKVLDDSSVKQRLWSFSVVSQELRASALFYLPIFAVGNRASVEGEWHTAANEAGHCEGTNNYAVGYASHAEGDHNIVANSGAHAEGVRTLAYGLASHAEGTNTRAYSSDSHVEGNSSVGAGTTAHAEGHSTIAYGLASHAEGYSSRSLADRPPVNNDELFTQWLNSEAPQEQQQQLLCAGGDYSHAEGLNTYAYGTGAHAEGEQTLAKGRHSHAGGYRCHSLADGSFTHGWANVTHEGHANSAVFGKWNNSPGVDSLVCGRYNQVGTLNDLFVIGNGSAGTQSNAFRVKDTGDVYTGTDGRYNSGGADYAEEFEWLHTPDEDCRGYFVTLDGDKIRFANSGEYILGITSATAGVLGNNPEDWNNRFLKDEFGSVLTEEYQYEELVTDPATLEKITVIKTGIRPQQNPEYDPTQPYIERDKRPEWAAVGMLGVLIVRDDGTCKVNEYCCCTDGGVATACDKGYRVISRINDHLIKVVFR